MNPHLRSRFNTAGLLFCWAACATGSIPQTQAGEASQRPTIKSSLTKLWTGMPLAEVYKTLALPMPDNLNAGLTNDAATSELAGGERLTVHFRIADGHFQYKDAVIEQSIPQAMGTVKSRVTDGVWLICAVTNSLDANNLPYQFVEISNASPRTVGINLSQLGVWVSDSQHHDVDTTSHGEDMFGFWRRGLTNQVDYAIREASVGRINAFLHFGQSRSVKIPLNECFKLVPGREYALKLETFIAPNAVDQNTGVTDLQFKVPAKESRGEPGK